MSPRGFNVSDVFWSVVAVAIISAGVLGFKMLGALREPVEPAPVERTIPLVEALPLQLHTGPLPVSGSGYIQPRQRITLAAETPGRVVELHPAMFTLGRVDKGETLVQLDDRMAIAAVERAESDIESVQARLALNASQMERATTLRKRGVISQEELDQRLAERDELTSSLSSLESARESARISLESMRIAAPFDAQIMSRAVDVGSIAGQGQQLAEVFTPDALEVTISLEEREAALIPDLFSQGNAAASVSVSFADRHYVWPGNVTRVSAQLSRTTRTLDVTITLADGAGVAATDAQLPLSSGTPPALVNAWAKVTINGQSNESVHAIPLQAMREDDTIWLVAAGTLRVVPVVRVHEEQGIAYVVLDPSVSASDDNRLQLVTSLLTATVDGMPVSVVSSNGEPAAEDQSVSQAQASNASSSGTTAAAGKEVSQ